MVPPRLRAVLADDERVLGLAETTGGTVLGATRYGLWVLDGDGGVRLDWDRVATARLADGLLTVVPVRSVGRWPGPPAGIEPVGADAGIDVARDATPVAVQLAGPTRLTDVVHARVRRSVATSGRLTGESGSGWLAWRRIPGRDGLHAQFRLDPGVDPDRPGLAAAAVDLARQLDPRS
ncbi:hypothetical protein GCM10009818_08490 [Nakamurella flavida]